MLVSGNYESGYNDDVNMILPSLGNWPIITFINVIQSVNDKLDDYPISKEGNLCVSEFEVEKRQ